MQHALIQLRGLVRLFNHLLRLQQHGHLLHLSVSSSHVALLGIFSAYATSKGTVAGVE